MTSTTFVSGTTIEAPWLNDVNKVTYNKTFPDGSIALSAQPGSLLDSSAVSYQPAGTGAVATIVQTKLRESVSVKDFGAVGDGVTNNYSAFILAIASIPAAGGVLHIPAGTYYLGTSGLLISRSNLTIIGEGMPQVSTNLYSLSGGTILQGTVVIDGNNISVSSLGVDCGTTYVTARNSGNGIDALAIHSVGQTSINKNTNVRDVVGLTKIATSTADATAAVHSVLLESLQYGSGDNIVGVGGWFGIVMKVSDFNFTNLIGRESDNVNVYLKSDTYGPVNRVNIQNIIANNTVTRGYSAVRIEASSAALSGVSIGNVTVQNPTFASNSNTGTSVMVAAAGVSPVSNLSIASVTTLNGSNGISVLGPCYSVSIDNASLVSGGGVGFSTGLGTAVTQPIDVTINNLRAASFTYGAVSIASANTLAVIGLINAANTGGNVDSTSTINVQTTTRVSQYIGTLLGNSIAPALKNGWAAAYGQATGLIAKSGTTTGYGRISAAAATADIFMTVPSGMCPDSLSFYTTMTAFNGSTSQLQNVTVYCDGANNLSLYPNRAAYSALSWFSLTDLKFPTQIPSTGGI